jgi:transketolase
MGSSLGLAFGAADHFGADAPRVHVIEGEGGLTPGRVAEAVAFAGTAGLDNAVVHLDWNQASIDSNAVTREGSTPGDYVQWDPQEYFYMNDWNVVQVDDGFDLGLVLAAQRRALEFDNGQPTAVVYRTVKGWRYGIEGRKSHGGGHKLCSPEYVAALEPLLGEGAPGLPMCEPDADAAEVEATYWATLEMLRDRIAADAPMAKTIGGAVARARERLDARGRSPRPGAGDVEVVYSTADPAAEPDTVALAPGDKVALRQQLGKVLGHLNRASGGAIVIGAADLLDSTAISGTADGFPEGFFHRHANPDSRTLSVGGICEDGMSCVLSGVSSFGAHVGAGASYGAFLAPLGHIAARLHAIGNQTRNEVEPGPNRTMVLICGHAGMKTGEDGPTHADPQALQLMQENFVPGMAITLTPWDPAEMWPVMTAAFRARPAVIVPFVTRPGEPVLDRSALGLAPAAAAADGVYRLREASGPRDGTLVIQESAVAYAFVQETLPLLEDAGIDLDVYYVASAELFDLLPAERREAILPADRAAEAMGITGFTLPTMYRWIRSDLGREHTLYPFRGGRYLGSGQGERAHPGSLPGRPLPGERPGRDGGPRGRARRGGPVRRDLRLRGGAGQGLGGGAAAHEPEAHQVVAEVRDRPQDRPAGGVVADFVEGQRRRPVGCADEGGAAGVEDHRDQVRHVVGQVEPGVVVEEVEDRLGGVLLGDLAVDLGSGDPVGGEHHRVGVLQEQLLHHQDRAAGVDLEGLDVVLGGRFGAEAEDAHRGRVPVIAQHPLVGPDLLEP